MKITDEKAWELVEDFLGFPIDIEDDYKHYVVLKQNNSKLDVGKIYPASYSGYSTYLDSEKFTLHLSLHLAHTFTQWSIDFSLEDGKVIQLTDNITLIEDCYKLKEYLDKYEMAPLNFKRAVKLNDILKEDGCFSLVAFNTTTMMVREDKSILKESLRLNKANPEWVLSRLFDNVHEPMSPDWYICEFRSFYDYYHDVKKTEESEEFINIAMVRYAKNNGVQWVGI